MNEHEEAREDLEIIEAELVSVSDNAYDILPILDNHQLELQVNVLGDLFKRLQDYSIRAEATEKELVLRRRQISLERGKHNRTLTKEEEKEYVDLLAECKKLSKEERRVKRNETTFNNS